jgi:hypothetical protein
MPLYDSGTLKAPVALFSIALIGDSTYEASSIFQLFYHNHSEATVVLPIAAIPSVMIPKRSKKHVNLYINVYQLELQHMDVGQNPVPPVNLKVDGHP